MDWEFEPLALLMGGIGGLVTIIVMKQVQVSFIWKILGFVLGAVLGYLVSAWRLGAD